MARLRAMEKGLVVEDNVTTKMIFEKAKEGNDFYRSVVQESAEKFAKIVSVFIDLFNPQAIIVGGVFMRNYDLFMSIIESIVKQESLTDAYEVCKILPAKMSENIGDYAALAIAVSGA